MGTTLENGIYLPDEGERNCYEGLAGNWVALDNHLGSTNIHVTINDKQAWDGHVADTTIHVTSADKQAWDGHVADTTIHVTSADKQAWDGHVADSVKHVTAEDKNKWDAVTSKADDSAVVHNSGNETIAGIKTFTDNTFVKSLNFTNEVASPSSSSSAILPIIATVTYTDQSSPQSARLNLRVTANGDKSLYPHENNQYSFGATSRRWTTLYGYLANLGGTYVGNEASPNERTNLYLLANRDTDGQSGAYIGRFRQNKAQGAMSGGDVSFVSFDFLENSTRYTRCFTMGLTDWDSNGVPQTYYITSPTYKGALGTAYQQWNKVYANEYYYGSNNVEFSNKFVTTDTAQTIGQNKTFTGVITINHAKGGIFQLTCPDLDNTIDVTGNWAEFISFNSVDGGQTVASKGAVGLRQFKNGKNFALLLVEGSETLYFGSKSNSDSTKALYPANSGVCDLGTSTNKWKTFNGLNPSALGMPDISQGIDISSYITNLSKSLNIYTPTVNGWIEIELGRSALPKISMRCRQTDGLIYSTETSEFSSWGMSFPVIGGKGISIYLYADSLNKAKFYPCLGNI